MRSYLRGSLDSGQEIGARSLQGMAQHIRTMILMGGMPDVTCRTPEVVQAARETMSAAAGGMGGDRLPSPAGVYDKMHVQLAPQSTGKLKRWLLTL